MNSVALNTFFAPWQQAVFQTAVAARREGRLAHALLLCGPAQLGKAQLAAALAESLLCSTPVDDLACGHCRSCKLIRGGTHPDFFQLSFEENERTGKLRSEIVIEQVRRLSAWFGLTAQLVGNQVALIHPADAMNTAAANALLKTLEEPLANRYLLLISSRPGRLPATIRSRCQRLEFRIPDRDSALAWLTAKGHDAGKAIAALDAAQGHPGLAADWLGNGGLEARVQVLQAMATLAQGRASPLELAQQWLADDAAAQRLQFAAEFALMVTKAGQGLADLPRGMALPTDIVALSAWFDQINLLREQLSAPLRHDLLLAGLLGQWRAIMQPAAARGQR